MNERLFYWGEFLAIVGLLSFGYYLENFRGIVPCPLCELQRVIFLILGCLYFINVLFVKSRRFFNVFVALFAFLGMLLSARQIWLEFFPPHENVVSVCDVSLGYILQIMPWNEALLNVIIGGPRCAEITWRFLYLSIPQWAFIWFGLFLVMALWKTVKPSRV